MMLQNELTQDWGLGLPCFAAAFDSGPDEAQPSPELSLEPGCQGRIVFVGAQGVGKSSLVDALCGRGVFPPNEATEWLSDYGLFCLIDLPDPPGGEVIAEPTAVERLIHELVAEADLLVYLLDGTLGLRPQDQYWLAQLNRLQVPLLPVLTKCDAPAILLARMLADIETRLLTPVLPVSTKNGLNLPDPLIWRMITICPPLISSLLPAINCLRRRRARKIVGRLALLNGLLALEPIPLLDFPVQFLIIQAMARRLAAIYGQPAGGNIPGGVWAAFISQLWPRYLAQQALKLIPGLGWLASGLIALTTTWLVGHVLVIFFEEACRPATLRAWLRLYDTWRFHWDLSKALWKGRFTDTGGKI